MDERPFNCSNCDRTFQRKYHLERHLNTHLNLTRSQIISYLEKFKDMKDITKQNLKINDLIKSNLKLKFKYNFNMDFEEIKSVVEPVVVPVVVPVDNSTKLIFNKVVPKSIIKKGPTKSNKRVTYYYEPIKVVGSKRKRPENHISEIDNKNLFDSSCYCFGCTMGGDCYGSYEPVAKPVANPVANPVVNPVVEPLETYNIFTNVKLSSFLFDEDKQQHYEFKEEPQCCKNLSDYDYIMHFKYDHKDNH